MNLLYVFDLWSPWFSSLLAHNSGEGIGTPFQYSHLENPIGGGAWPWGREESDTTERLPFHFSLSCIGEENGNSFQCSCLENPRDGGAWWTAVYGVTQSQTRLKWLSSSSNQKCSRYSTSTHGLGSYIRPCQPRTSVEPIEATSFKVKKLTANLFQSITFFYWCIIFTLLC